MRHVVWIVVGWLGVTLWTAIGSRLNFGHVLPDAAVVTVAFVALRREPILAAVTALVLGYLVGRQALAPVGLHETTLVACAVGVYMTSGRIAGSGAFFFAAAAAATLVAYHLTLFLLMTTIGEQARFAGWATAILIPNAALTGLLALISYPWMTWLERKLVPSPREGLSWR